MFIFLLRSWTKAVTYSGGQLYDQYGSGRWAGSNATAHFPTTTWTNDATSSVAGLVCDIPCFVICPLD